jgi:hypothetical protein
MLILFVSAICLSPIFFLGRSDGYTGAVLVQSSTATINSVTKTWCNFTSAVSAGDTIIFVQLLDGETPINTPTDDRGTTYSLAGAVSGGQYTSVLYYGIANTSGSNAHITQMTTTGSIKLGHTACFEYAGNNKVLVATAIYNATSFWGYSAYAPLQIAPGANLTSSLGAFPFQIGLENVGCGNNCNTAIDPTAIYSPFVGNGECNGLDAYSLGSCIYSQNDVNGEPNPPQLAVAKDASGFSSDYQGTGLYIYVYQQLVSTTTITNTTTLTSAVGLTTITLASTYSTTQTFTDTYLDTSTPTHTTTLTYISVGNYTSDTTYTTGNAFYTTSSVTVTTRQTGIVAPDMNSLLYWFFEIICLLVPTAFLLGYVKEGNSNADAGTYIIFACLGLMVGSWIGLMINISTWGVAVAFTVVFPTVLWRARN